MKKIKEPIVPTVNGKTAIVVHDAESNRALLELESQAEVVKTLRQRLATRREKTARTAEDFFAEFFAKNKIAVEE